MISNFRASHSFPLNTFQMGLRRRARKFDTNALVSQRLKRLSSIALKLELLPSMKLSQMQDIGGCRAVVKSVPNARAIVADYLASDIKHELIRANDYIQDPKPSGYRSYHLVYRYNSDRQSTYNNLKIEVQIRSSLQHAWATAVETVGTFIRQALKSSQGEEEWLRFFALMGSEIARRERGPLVPGTPTNAQVLKREIRGCAKSLDVQKRLTIFGAALQAVENSSVHARFFLLQLNAEVSTVSITGYRQNALEQASRDYLKAEENAISRHGLSDSVLVSVESIDSLRRAYPNYFLDTKVFIQMVERAIE